MAGLRKGHCYTPIERPYTRKSKFKAKGFIKAVPACKVSRFELGDPKKKFQFRITLEAKDALQIRHNALESARQIVNRSLEKGLGANYLFKVRLYPHHVLRENRMLTGAGADRMSTGMQLSFGTTVGLAAQTKAGKVVMSADVEQGGIEIARKAMDSARPRLPGHYVVKTEKIIHKPIEVKAQ